MKGKEFIPELVTLTNGFVASLSLLMVVGGQLELGVRLVFLCMGLDVLDGLLARHLGVVSERGEFLDRLFDRVYQVIVPAILYFSNTNYDYMALVYSSMIITGALWRLSRRVPGREYFAGLPLFVHTIVVLSSFISGIPLPPFAMIVLGILSLVPLKYYRRSLRFSSSENRGTYWALRLAVPVLLAVSPLSRIRPVFQVILYLSLIYAVLGWTPFLRGEGKLTERVFHTARIPVYK